MPSQTKLKGLALPITEINMEPSSKPLHNTLTMVSNEIVGPAAFKTETLRISEQLLSSYACTK